jgi:hypothetical protein
VLVLLSPVNLCEIRALPTLPATVAHFQGGSFHTAVLASFSQRVPEDLITEVMSKSVSTLRCPFGDSDPINDTTVGGRREAHSLVSS